MQEQSRGMHRSLNPICGALDVVHNGWTDGNTGLHHEDKHQYQPQTSASHLGVYLYVLEHCLFPICLCVNANKSNVYVYRT